MKFHINQFCNLFQGLVAAEWAPVSPSTYKYHPKYGFTFLGSSNILGTYECSVHAVGSKVEVSLVVKGSSGKQPFLIHFKLWQLLWYNLVWWKEMVSSISEKNFEKAVFTRLAIWFFYTVPTPIHNNMNWEPIRVKVRFM